MYDPEVWKAVPEEFQDYTLEKLVHNRIELENFNQFLAEKVRKHCLAWVWSPILNPQLREMMFIIILLFMNSALNNASFVHSKLRKRECVNNIFHRRHSLPGHLLSFIYLYRIISYEILFIFTLLTFEDISLFILPILYL